MPVFKMVTVMQSFMICALLVVLLPEVAASPGGFPLDLYLVMDSSKSIGFKDNGCANAVGIEGLRCWDLFVDFANDTQNALASRVNGYYGENEGEDGLRVSVITFDECEGQKEFIPLTGNKTAIDEGFNGLRSNPLTFGTCPSSALSDVVNSIYSSESSRPKAVLFISDGEVQSSDRQDTNLIASTLNSIESVSTFALGIGSSALGTQAQNIVGGNTDHLFKVEDASFLSTVINFISAFILDDISFSIKDDPLVVQLRDPENGRLCVGDDQTAILLEGRSVAVLQGQSSDCVFQFPDKEAGIVVPTRTSGENLECPYPVHFGFELDSMGKVQNFTVRVQVNQANEEPRVLGSAQEFSVPVSSCLVVNSNSNGICVGESLNSAFEESVAAQLDRYTSLPAAAFTCKFFAASDLGQLLHSAPPSVSLTGMTCVAPPILDDASLQTLYGAVELHVSSAGLLTSDAGSFLVQADSFLPAAYARDGSCVSALFPVEDVCWSSSFEVQFSGVFLDAVAATEALECAVSASHMSDVVGELRQTAPNTFTCEVPGMFSEQDGQETAYTTDAQLRIKSTGAVVAQLTEVISIDPCLSIPSDKQVCLGNELELAFVGPSASLLAAEEGVNDFLVCMFSVKGSDVQLNRTISISTVNEASVISCIAPPSIGEYLGVVFSKIELVYGSAGVVFQQELDVNILACFDLLDETGGMLSEQAVGLDACWGDTPGRFIEIKGDSAVFLQEAPVACAFTELDVTIPAQTVMETGSPAGFRCDIPDELFVSVNTGRIFDTTVRIRVEGAGNKFNFPYEETIRTRASTGDPDCMSRAIRNLNLRPQGVVCWGDLVELETSGLVADRVAEIVGDDFVVCHLAGHSESYNYTYADDGSGFKGKCILPREVSIDVKEDHFIQFVNVDKGNEVVIETQLPPVRLDNSENCVKYSKPVTEDGETLCLGGLVPNEYAISGVVIDFIVEESEFDVDNGLRCSWSGSSGNDTTIPALRENEQTIVCSAPVWEPWVDPGSGFYDRLEIRLVSENVLISALDLLKTKLCLEKDHPATLANSIASTEGPNSTTDGSRLLAPVETPQEAHGSCWPFCCFSGSNSVVTGGQSAKSLEREGQSGQVTCTYGDPATSRTASRLPLSGGLAGYSCYRSGWLPFDLRNDTEFQFNQLNISVSGNFVQSFDLPAVDTMCIRQLPEEFFLDREVLSPLAVCRGEPVSVSVDGISLDSALEWQRDALDTRRVDCTIHLSGEDPTTATVRKQTATQVSEGLSISFGSRNTMHCTRLFPFASSEPAQVARVTVDAVRAVPGDLLTPSGGRLPIDEWAAAWDRDALVTLAPGFQYRPVDECVAIAEPTCSRDSPGRVVVSGRTVSSLLARETPPEINCLFAQSEAAKAGAPRIEPAEYIPSNASWLCVYNLTASGERYFELLARFPRGDVDAGESAAAEAVVVSHTLVCPDTLFGAGPSGAALSSGELAGLVVGLILLVVFLVVFCRCWLRRKAQKEREEEQKVDQAHRKGLRRGSGGDSVLPLPQLWGNSSAGNVVVKLAEFSAGDRVEARFPFSDDGGGAKSPWWKGTVIGQSNGEYEVGFDEGKIPDASGISEGDIRTPLSDFAVGESVLVSRRVGDQSTRSGIVAAVECNNKYTIRYKPIPGERDEESNVRGARIQGASGLHFKAGDVVECENLENGNWKRATIKRQIPKKFEFEVEYESGLTGQDSEVVHVERLRVPEFHVGDVVEAQVLSKKDQSRRDDATAFSNRPWLRAQIARVNDDHTYRVTYDEKGVSDNNSLGIRWIRRPQFVVNDVVEVLKSGTWKCARVTNVDENNTYNLTFGSSSSLKDERYVLAPLLRRSVPKYSVGDRVEVRPKPSWGATEEWLGAVITQVSTPGSATRQPAYGVVYDDAALAGGRQTEENVASARIQPHIDAPLVTRGTRTGPAVSIDSHPSFGSGPDTSPMLIPVPLSPRNGVPLSPRYGAPNVPQSPRYGAPNVPQSPRYGAPNVPISPRHSELPTVAKPPAPAKEIVANALTTNFRPPPREHSTQSEGPGMKPMRLRFKRTAPLDFAELPNNTFEVKVDMSQGLGISLGWTKESTIIVAGFKDLHNGDWGPVEACGLVGLKDQLLAVNGKSIGGLSFATVSQMISSSPQQISLRFGRSHTDKISLALT